MSNRLIRQQDLINSDILTTPLFMVGLGGIGSWTAISLAKMGFNNMILWDMDIVSEENFNNQFYSIKEINIPKTYCIYDRLNQFANINPEIRNLKWSKENSLPNQSVIISAVDNMTTRKELFEEACLRKYDTRLFIDGRMGGHQIEVYTVNIYDRKAKENYAKSLWTESEAANVPCTARATMYNCLMIASFISNNIRLGLEDKPYKPCIIFDMENISIYTPESR